MAAISSEFYTQLASEYGNYTLERFSYVNAVNQMILQNLGGESILDVGAGDGLRSMRLAREAGLEKITYVEPNAAMAKLCRENTGSEVIEVCAEDLSCIDGQYDNIFCLYNVLGHVGSEEKRVLALKNMADKLRDGGSIYLDVNNRHNIRAYGPEVVSRNVTREEFEGNEVGDVYFEINIAGNVIKASGHVFSLDEMVSLVDKSGLKIKRQGFIDYDSGEVADSEFEGQMFFELVKPWYT